MKITELIQELETIKSKYGDCNVVIDIPERQSFCFDFAVIDGWYSLNGNRDMNNCFLVAGDEEL